MRNHFTLTALSLLCVLTVATAQAPDDTTLVIAQSTDPTTFDPAEIGDRASANIAEHIWGTLLKISPEGEINPYLAESYKVSEDGKEVSFTLRKGLTCDDGEALTAEDVAYTFQRAADPANAFTGNTPGFILTSIGYADARADDDLTATIVMKEPNAIAAGLLAEVYIHCKDSYEKMSLEQAAENPVGSGPYRFAEWVKDDHVTLEKNPDFTLEAGNFETLIWRTIPEASTRSAELIGGNVDVVAGVSPDQQDAINNSGSASVVSVSGTRRIYIGFNFKPSFAEASEGGAAVQKTAVRVALQYAVDVPTICESLLGTPCERASGMVNPPNNNTNLEPYPFDPDKAEQLLDEAGYPRGDDGVRFSLTLQAPNGRYLNDANVALAAGQYLSDIGVETNVEPMDFSSVYVPLIVAHDAGPVFLLGSGGGLWSALYDMTDIATPDSGTNYTEWNNSEWFDGWARLAKTNDETERQNIVNEMQEIFYNDPPWLMLYFQPDFYGVSSRLDWEPRRDEHINVVNAVLK